MKTVNEICQAHNWSGSLAMFRELHQSGHYGVVLNYLKNNQTSPIALILYQEICIIGNITEILDAQGVYAGTHYEVRYRGELVFHYTNWSLFN